MQFMQQRRVLKFPPLTSAKKEKRKALQLAKEHKVSINYDLLEASEFQKEKTYDAVALIYAHFPDSIRSHLFHQLEKSLGKGGCLILEVFSKNQLGRSSGGPKNLELLYSAEEINALFPTIQFSMLEEMKIELDEGKTTFR